MDNLPAATKYDPYAHGLGMGFTDLFTPFLGPLSRPMDQSALRNRSVAKWNMPEAYAGQNLYLQETVEDWTLTANYTFYTQRILPWFKTDQINIQWETWENNAHIMEITPHQTGSKIVTQKRKIGRASVLRRGIGAEFESDFVKTSMGRSSFIASLAQIGRAFQETANLECIKALLNCHRTAQVYQRKQGIIADYDLDGYWERQTSRFMIAQKDRFGLEKLNTIIEAEQEKYNAKANVWILSRDVMDYCDLVPPEKIFFDLGGQQAVDRVNGLQQGPSAAGGTMGNVASLQPPRMVRDTPVFLAKCNYVDGTGQADLLSRNVEVGVHNTMIDKNHNYHEYTTASRNIRVYSNDHDDWRELKLEHAIEHCILWDESGKKIRDPWSSGSRGPATNYPADVSEEGRHDFLRFGDPGAMRDVEYVGDFEMRWLKRRNVEGGAQTVLNVIKGRGTFNVPITTPGFEGQKDQGRPINAGEKGFSEFDSFITQAHGLLGGNENLFFKADTFDSSKGQGRQEFDKQPVNNLRKWYQFSGYAKAKKIATVEIGGTIDQEPRHKEFLTNVLGVMVPEQHRAILPQLVAQQGSWEDRAASITVLLQDLYKKDKDMFPNDVNSKKFGDKIKARIDNYKKEVEQVRAQVATEAPQQQDVISVAVGEPLPVGYEFASPAEAEKWKQPAKQFPTSLKDFPFLSHFFEQKGDATRVQGGRTRGIGRELIGAARPKDDADVMFEGVNIKVGALRILHRYNNLEARIFEIANSTASDEIKWLSLLFLGVPLTRDMMLRLAQNNIYVPLNFALFRTHCQYRTRYGIKVASDGQAGYMVHGHGDMQIQHDAVRKVGLLHYTTYLSPVIYNPKNVYPVENLFCTGYLGGMGVSFWSVKEYLSKGGNRKKKSIVCTMLPPHMEEDLETKVDIRGQWFTEYKMKLVEHERFVKVCYPGAARTAAVMGWHDPIRGGKGIDQAMRTRTAMNYVCFQGVQWCWNSKTNDWGNVTIEQGHFGPKVYPGCGKVRNGALKYLETPSYLGNSNDTRG